MRELSLSVMDVTQNSITAKSTLIKIIVLEDFDKDMMSIKIEDNGCGMSEEQVRHVTDPFFTTRTTRKVGMGIPLFKMAAEMTGGNFTINSDVGVGTNLEAVFVPSHIDMIPLGDINLTILPLVTGNVDIDFVFTRTRVKNGETRSFTLDTKEIKEVLGEDISLNYSDVVLWLGEFLEENTNELENF